ncbi:MAG: TRIC cation channel family protein [Acidimicrobiales bacterium]
MLFDPCLLATNSVSWGGFEWTGDFTFVDLVAASTNALNGALLARRPDHYKQFTVVGILLMALLGGIGGGVIRDVLLAQVPAALTNPAYIFLALAFGYLGYRLAYGPGQLFREGLFQFMTAFSLPWYAIVGAQKGVTVGLPVWGCLLLAIVGPTAGRYYIDITSGVTPKQFIRGEWFVATAANDRARLDPRVLGGRQHLVGNGHRLRGRLLAPHRGVVPRLGGAVGERAQGRCRPR